MAPYITETTTTTATTDSSSTEPTKNTTPNLEISGLSKLYTEFKTYVVDSFNNHVNSYGMPLIWLNIISIIIFHIAGLYAFYLFPYIQCWRTLLWGFVVGGIGGFGVTAGVHRYWCHRSYKANLPVRILLMLCYTVSGQNTIYDWVRDHRVHHKFSETDADPHNAKRGFFFSHVGWLMMRKHPDVLNKGKVVDMSDVINDPVVQFSQNHFTRMKLIFCFFIPTLIPVVFWGESWVFSFCVTIARYVTNLNCTWLVNSAAHMWGSKPYDRRISPVENLSVSIVAMGEGWHNYHHTFPWDYKAAELGNYHVNLTTMWLDFFAYMGWVWDRKQPSPDLVQKVIARTGDGSHFQFGHDEVPEDADFDINEIKKSY